ncbi:MAG TPA: hypothetical protein VIN59_06665 [Alphaproteobacteria bacterium]
MKLPLPLKYTFGAVAILGLTAPLSGCLSLSVGGNITEGEVIGYGLGVLTGVVVANLGSVQGNNSGYADGYSYNYYVQHVDRRSYRLVYDRGQTAGCEHMGYYRGPAGRAAVYDCT